MNLVDLRDRLRAIDAALSEIAKYVSKAGSELIKANVGIGSIMGEEDRGNGRVPRKRRARKPKEAERAAVDERGSSIAITTMSPSIAAGSKRGRGRPKAPEAEKEGNSELAAEAS